MSRRNLTLLIIILVIALIAILGFFYFRRGAIPGGNTGGGTNFIDQFNPFGNNPPKPPVTTPPVDVSEPTPPVGGETKNVKLKKVSSMPIAGFILFPKERLKEIIIIPQPLPSSETVITTPPAKGSSGSLKPIPPKTEFVTAVRYAEKAGGLIYETFADTIAQKQFSKTVIPKIYEAAFGSMGESVVMRYLKGDDRTIETFTGSLPKEYLGTEVNGSAELKGLYLPENITDMSISPDASKMFYLFNTGDSAVGTTMNFADTKKTQIFNSPFTEWLSQWPNIKTVTLTTKPSAGVPGYMYSLDVVSKKFIKTIGGVGGLVTLTSPDGKLVLYSDSGLSLYVYHIDSGTSDLLGVKTLAEKCVWGKASDTVYCAVPKTVDFASYPDAWYQGEVSFSDQMWRLDTKSGNATLLVDPIAISGGEDIDGTKLAVDDGGNYLFFVNKKDSYLWEFSLK